MTDLVGLTNALTDIVVKVSEDELSELKLRKGQYNSGVNISYPDFLKMISEKDPVSIPGGSPANVVHGVSILGFRTALFGTVGNDEYGVQYGYELEKAGIVNLLNVVEGSSGLCYTLVTPDDEKSSLAVMGVAGQYDFDFSRLEGAKFFHTSAYELATNSDRTEEAIDFARRYNAKVSFDFAGTEAIRSVQNTLDEILQYIDILFVTEEEAEEFTGYDPMKALEGLSEAFPIVVLKKGKNGSIVRRKKEQYDIPIYPVILINTNGAGDAYAAGFLSGYLKGFPLKECGHAGSYFAARICSKTGPRF